MDNPAARLDVLASHCAAAGRGGAAAGAAAAPLPPKDLFGGAGFTDAVGLRYRSPDGPRPPTSRERLMRRLAELGLEGNARELDEEGWTVVPGAMSADLTARLRTHILAITDDQLKKKRRSGVRFAQLGSLLYHGEVFEEACQNPKQMALSEYMLGASYGIWQYLCSVRGEGTGGLPLHNDLGGWREPFQVFPEMCTSIFVTDEYNRDTGATFVVPRTHHKCRRPRLDSAADRALVQRDAVAVNAAPGSVVMWDGRLWHGSLPRRVPGERVICSYVCTRVHIRASEDWTQLPADVVARNPPRFARMIGRGTGIGEGGKGGGGLFGEARRAAATAALTRDEEELPEGDVALRMRRFRAGAAAPPV